MANVKFKMDVITDYFQSFSHKDIDALAEMYAEDVSLIDWIDAHKGKQSVLNANKELFSNASSINVSILNTYPSNWGELNDGSFGWRQIACQIRIDLTVGGFDQFFNVIDVIKLDKDNKIKSIEAYVMNPSGT